MLLYAVIILWIICGALAYGITYADFQRNFPTIADITERMDVDIALFMAVMGPIGLFVAFFASGFAPHGLRYRRFKKGEER